MATFFWKLLLWSCLCLVLTFRVEAQEQETGTQLLCDTKAHVQMFVAFHESGLSDMEAVAEVNAEAHQTTCMIMSAEFYRGEQLATAEIDEGTIAIVEVLLVGIQTGKDKWSRVPPMLQYTTFLIAKSEEASLPLVLVRYDPEWENRPLHVRKWFQQLMQPDYPDVSCCGDADAYEADEFEQDGENWVAIVTGQGPETSNKPIIPEGTRIKVPNHKMKWDQGNPTGHGIIFVGPKGEVFCYVTPALL